MSSFSPQHIQFLDNHQGRSALVLTTADHSKGQEAETVFILGVDRVYDKRLYITAPRAKSRLFMIGGKEKIERHRILQEAQNYNIYNVVDKTQVLDANSLSTTH